RRGRAGTSDLRVWTEYGTIDKSVEFPDNVLNIGSLVRSTATRGRCDIVRQAVASQPTGVGCTAVTQENRYNPLEASTSPLKTGNRESVGASVSGGGDVGTYYFSGEYDNETGIQPQNDLRRIRFQANSTGRV